MPSDLQVIIGRKVIKQTRRTANVASARLRAVVLASDYAHAYDVLRDRRVDRFSKKDLEAFVDRLSGMQIGAISRLPRMQEAGGRWHDHRALADRPRRRRPSHRGCKSKT
ncbi:hypothetical protein [Xanthomonas arboricola]|uniref:hypothetical protein n=1 Tax=Xanthomonas arboricola TaxID=56448 RepID=UPI003D1622D0